MNDCIFCRIIRGEIPSTKLFEDEDFVIIKEIAPAAPLHYLLIPKKHFANLSEASAEDAALVGECLKRFADRATELGFGEGYRFVSNCGANAMQSVSHVHFHIVGGKLLGDILPQN